MLFVFGSSPKLTDLGMRQQTCRYCGNHAAQRVVKQQQRVSVFFIPIFSVSTKYLMTCTACGGSSRLSKDEAQALAV